MAFLKKETMAFGDGENDITMLSNVGIGVAMGNANEAVKKVALNILLLLLMKMEYTMP